jgi:hypothetical protein
MAVFTARVVFQDREAERTHQRQSWRKTLPITMAAMLIEIAFVVQQNLNLPSAIFTGLGVGWVTVLLLDLFGERIIDIVKAAIGTKQQAFMPLPPTTSLGDLPQDMKDDLSRIDQADKEAEGGNST